MPARELVLLDDGTFYIDLNANHPPEDAPGFLEVRNTRGFGVDCVGSFDRLPCGKWSARVAIEPLPSEASDALALGTFEKRLDAIAALWLGRHRARPCRG